jgi:hypothetical protein
MSESSVEQPSAPAWLVRIVDWFREHERLWLLVGMGFQMLVLVGTVIMGLR